MLAGSRFWLSPILPDCEVGADLLVLDAVEAVLAEELLEVGGAGEALFVVGQQAIEERVHHAGERGLIAARLAEEVEFSALGGGQVARFAAHEIGQPQPVVGFRHQRGFRLRASARACRPR